MQNITHKCTHSGDPAVDGCPFLSCVYAVRPETFSPNKVELLANLKRRQIEKRAPSSQLNSRRPSNEGNDLQPHKSSMSSNAVLQRPAKVCLV